MKKRWDHGTKPSTYIVSLNEEELFRGTYTNGMMYIKSLKNDGMISFKDDYLPAVCNSTKRAYRALKAEKELRREVLKLNKELKKTK